MSICEDLPKEMDEMLRDLYHKLINRGYMSLYLLNMLLGIDEPPCNWCEERYRLNDIEQVTRVLYIIHDEAEAVRDYISVKSNIKVKDLTSLAENHPDDSCHFVEAQLFQKVYDGENEALRDRIIERGFHPNFYRQEIIRKYIRTGENAKLYYMVMKHNDLCCITYVLSRDCAVDELHRYTDYLWEMKTRYHIDNNTLADEKPFIISSCEVGGDDPTKMRLMVRDDMSELNLAFDMGPWTRCSYRKGNTDRCYHESSKIAHGLILAEAFNKHHDIVLNLRVNSPECFCKCLNKPAIPDHPEKDTFYAKSTFKLEL